MAAQLLSGKTIGARVREEVKARAEAFLASHGRPPRLTVVLVGDDEGSQVYVRNKERASAKVGIDGRVLSLPGDASEQQVLDAVTGLNADPEVDGVLVQLPLPDGLDEERVLHAIDPAKDVDGLHPVNAGRLATGAQGLRPCTPSGCMRMLDETAVELTGKRALVVGRSNLVGRPVAQLLLERHCTVTVAHSRSEQLPALVAEADILVAAAGVPGLIQGAWVKPGAVVLDVGITRGSDGKLSGDVQFDEASERAGWITPVPGGVGPMTIAMLLSNTVQAAEARRAG